MEGTIVHFRGSRRVKRTNQMVLQVPGVDNKDKACKMIGKKVVWKTSAGREMVGQITNIHGNSGALRVRFDIGLPGQSIGTKVVVE